MFNALREGSLFYILHKGENPRLRIGQVTAKSEPKPKFGNTQAAYGFAQEMVIDITVKADEDTYTFDALSTQDAFKFYPEKGVFITDSREQMLAEVETMLRTSTEVLDSVSFHENVVKECDTMLRRLNPQLAKEKAQEEKIGALESKISGVETTLCSIQEMLAEALNGRAGSRKSNNTNNN